MLQEPGAGRLRAWEHHGNTSPRALQPYISEGRKDPIHTSYIKSLLNDTGRYEGYILSTCSHTQVPRAAVFVTTKIPCVGTAELALQYIRSDLAQLNLAQVIAIGHKVIFLHEPALFHWRF